MVSAVSASSFANKKPNLTGSDTHGAQLTGSVSATPDSGSINTLSNGSENFSQNPYQTFISANQVLVTVPSVVVAADESVLLTYVWISEYDNNNQTGAMAHELQRDTVEINTFNNGNYSGDFTAINSQYIDTPGAGTFEYRIQVTTSSDLGGYQYVALRANVITVTDTHAASLTGSNTQETKNINILRG